MKKEKEITKRLIKPEWMKRTVSNVFTALVVAAVFGITPVLAADGLTGAITSALEKIYIAMIAITPALVIVVYVCAKIWQTAVPEKEGRREPRDWSRAALVNYAKILAAGGIITFIAEIASGFPGFKF